ncbi:MAG: thioesterase family protein [Cyclobacteriaceae bacterium]
MFVHETEVRVRYAETDQMGYVYYGNYLTYYELGRVEAFRSLGISYRELEERGIMMPVLEARSRYLKPALYDKLITIRTSIREMPGVRIRFHYDLFDGETLIHEGETELVFVNKNAGGRPCRIPEDMEKALAPHFSDEG